MAIVKKTLTVPFSAAQMFDLVNDIAQYPQFVPMCAEAKVLHQDADEVRASLYFSRGGLGKSFTTANRLQPHKMIEIRLLDGPFHHMQGFWRFEALGESECKVMFDVEFEFSSHLLSLAFGPIFHQVANTMVDVFHERACEVYA